VRFFRAPLKYQTPAPACKEITHYKNLNPTPSVMTKPSVPIIYPKIQFLMIDIYIAFVSIDSQWHALLSGPKSHQKKLPYAYPLAPPIKGNIFCIIIYIDNKESMNSSVLLSCSNINMECHNKALPNK
jgi:hypothetical protein